MTDADSRSDADGLDELYAYSTVTDTWYLVHDYEEAGPNGKIVANGKTEVDQEEVPEHWQKAIKNNLGESE